MIDLKQPNQKKTIVTGTGIVSEAFRPDAGMSGNFKVAATPNSSGLERRIYISRKPGGKPLPQFYQNGKRNAADKQGAEPAINWSTYPVDSRATCVLEPGKLYYLNMKQVAFTTKPNARSSLVRAINVRNK